MIGDAYKIKYSDYVLNLNGTDNGRFIEIEATDYTSRPGVNTTNFNHSNPAKRAPLDVILYGHRSRGYGAPLWNNLFYMLENFAQPSETTSVFPRYDKNPTVGQIWVDTTFEPAVPRWYGRDNTFYKLGASINISANASQVTPGELWFDTSVYAFKSYDIGWSDISCIPYASQREYNKLAVLTNALTTIPGNLPILTGSAKPTPALWAALITNVRLLAQANAVFAPTPAVDALAIENFMICNAGQYGVATIKSTFSQIEASIAAIESVLYAPTQLPLAGFTASSTTGVAPMVVNFTNTSTQTTVNSRDMFGPTQYTWDFGDGTTSTIPGNVSHTYTTAGARTVTLTLVNSVGTTSTQTIITAVGSPVANFMVGPDSSPDISATAPFTLAFTDQSTGSPTSWLWDFGDGTTSSNRNPSHTYSTLGDFTVSLLATNAAGSNTATVTHAVQIGNPTIANFTYTTPTRPTNDATPFAVTFADTTTNSPTAWLWNFGDGTTSTQQNPTHNYTGWGRYTVSLTATNALSNTSLDVGNTSVKTMTNLVQVGLAPTPAFTLSSGVGALPITVTATDTTANNPTSWSWDFGDGSPLVTTQHASHTYTTNGTRTVTLTVTNVMGSQSSSQTVTITPPAVVTSFGHSTNGSTVPVVVTYTDTSSNSPTAWLWNFGDGTTSNLQNPTHTYTTPGTYTTTLAASNYAGGDSNSINITANRRTVYITVTAAGIQNFTVSNNVNTSQHGTGVTVGGNGYSPGQTDVIVTVNANCVIGSVSTAYPAFDVGSGWTLGDYVELRVLAYGYVVGCGGAGGGYGAEGLNGYAGGTAINVGSSVPFTIFNYGTIGGGGGGGGRGSPGDRMAGGGGGGGGAGYNGGLGGNGAHLQAAEKGGAIIPTIYGSDGSLGGTTTGGAGGAGSYYGGIGGDGYGISGGNGGSLGAAGSEGGRWLAAQSPGAGGAGGSAVKLNGHTVAWGATGTRYGAIG